LSNVLERILAHKRAEVEQRRRQCPVARLQTRAEYLLPCRNFYGAVTVPRRGGPNLIAEIKRASPSAGLIKPDFDPVAIARQYAAGGAQALSVLTDEKYFGGDMAFIAAVKEAVGAPVLRKDFIIDPYQVHESRAYGADAILLIAESLDESTLAELLTLARSLGLWILLEVHDRPHLLAVLNSFTKQLRDGVLLGINNRDLKAQKTDLATTEGLAPLVPPGIPIVAESGIENRRDAERMHAAGARALLVGEALLRAADPAQAVRDMLG
jgi:indole-3-glycerol phosphate synthase